ncbi:MAG TPA: M48 family metalloprotease, partial [Xanthomonadaceae bacterium]|nr:M48 family metalloprotease [Xanthomonadaceae bacterium]
MNSRILFVLLSWALCLPAAAQVSRIELPDMGSSAANVISPGEERELVLQIVREMRRMGWLLDDPLIDEYLDSLGFRLVAHSERPGDTFAFYLVRERSINAFATPGGLVGVHAGLFLAAESEDEVAAVLGHEVAHVTQRHVARRFESMQKVSIPLMLAMIGTMIAASKTSGDAVPATIATGMGLMQQQNINFTRQNEYEADRIGIQTLARAGYDPAAVATIFGRMARAYRGPGDVVPEYLRTHPVTTTRIAEARSRAENLEGAFYVAPTAQPLHPRLPATFGIRSAPEISAWLPEAEKGLRFRLMRERIRVLTVDFPQDALRYYRELARSEIEDRRPAQYGEALALIAANRAAEARPLIARLLADDADNVLYRLADADARLMLGDHQGADHLFVELGADFPGHRAITLAHARALVHQGGAEAGRRAQELLRPLLAPESSPALYVAFARASELAGDEIRAGEAHAEAAFLGGQAEDALRLLESLSKREDL